MILKNYMMCFTKRMAEMLRSMKVFMVPKKGYGQYGDIFQKTIRTSGLKVASQERGRKALQEALTGDSSLKKDFVYNVKARAYNPYLGPKQQGLAKRALRDLNAGKVTPAVYDVFNSEIVGTHGQDPLSKKVFSTLKKQGFHAIEDMNDRKYSGYGAKSATIVFDKTRATVESVRKVSTKEIVEKAKYERQVINGKPGSNRDWPLLELVLRLALA